MKKVLVLGPGCPKCEKLLERTNQAAEQSGQPCQVEKITDIQKIVGYGVMMTPALVIDDRVVVTGRVPEVDELIGLLSS